jgi:hypothetical protein
MRDQSMSVKIVRYAIRADVCRYRKTRWFSLTRATRYPRPTEPGRGRKNR